MIKNILFKVLFLSFSVLFFSFAESTKYPVADLHTSHVAAVSTLNNEELAVEQISSTINDSLHLDDMGLSTDALKLAVKGYHKLVEDGTINNTQYLTIVDLSQSSRMKRFYLLDVENMKLVINTFVAHGKNSGLDKAQQFSNLPNSEESSLGFYVTKSTYRGKHGLSLKLSGLEDGFNDNAESRGIVVHGASYVNAARANSNYMGRSQGCPALPEKEYAKVIQLIKDGSVLFVYNPDDNYLSHSNILNS